MLNPFARFTAPSGPCAFERTGPPLSSGAIFSAIPSGDPYLNQNLNAAVAAGAPVLRLPPPSVPAAIHDLASEARYVAATYDATNDGIAASITSCTASAVRPLNHVIWLVPDFEVPFYGGIHTILAPPNTCECITT